MGKKSINRKSKRGKKSKKAIKLINKLAKEISTLSKSEYKKVSKDLIRLTGRKPVKMNKKVLKRQKVKKTKKTKKTKRGIVKSGQGTSTQNMPGQPTAPVWRLVGKKWDQEMNRPELLGVDLSKAKEKIGWNIIDGITWGSGFLAMEVLGRSLMSHKHA
tara:strand:+ start:1325 stop:1801 length:477 start_codon:yes stop_codon:yes gene_type:complete